MAGTVFRSNINSLNRKLGNKKDQISGRVAGPLQKAHADVANILWQWIRSNINASGRKHKALHRCE